MGRGEGKRYERKKGGSADNSMLERTETGEEKEREVGPGKKRKVTNK